ncbi:restriction endonuclease subunit S [Enterococcus faecalis]|nr:restriction endonuclease subunit S [Enterococcus faecalis]
MKKAPRIRFRGFQEDWEQRKLGGIGKTYTGLTGKSKEDFGHGDAKFVTYMNVFQNPKATLEQLENVEIDHRQNEVKKGDVFFTTSSETPEEVGMSSVWTHDINNIYLNSFTFAYRPTIKFDLDYLAFMLRSQSVRKKIIFLAQGISRYNISKTKMMDISVPIPVNFEEQQKIGAFFKQLDDTIALHQRKLDQLKELKTAYLQVMFVSMKTKNNKVPKLRFADFGGEWDQRKSKELFIPKSEKNQPNLPVLSVTQDSGVVYRDQVGIDIKYDSTTLKNYKVVNKNDFVISLRSFQGGFELSDKKGITSPAYTIFVPKDIKLHDNLFWKTQFKTFQFIEALKTVTFGIRDGKSISFTEFGDLKLCFPKNKKEQQKIGKFFEELDYAISLHQNKLTQLKSLKKSYLQNMFI